MGAESALGSPGNGRSRPSRWSRSCFCLLGICAGSWWVAGCSRGEPGSSRVTTPANASSLVVATPAPTNPRNVPANPAAAPAPSPTLPALSPSASPPAEAPAPVVSRRDASLQQRCHLLAAGDSLTDPKSGGGAYLELARRSCGCAITNLGQGGAMVNQIRKRFLAHLNSSRESYTHALIFGGVNDLYSDLTAKRTVKKISADLEAMYHASKQRGLTVIAITVTPWGGFERYFTEQRWNNTLLLNAWIRDSSKRETTQALTDVVLDGEHLLACGDAKRLCDAYSAPYRDGLHFGPKGHRQLALALVRALGPKVCPEVPDAGPG